MNNTDCIGPDAGKAVAGNFPLPRRGKEGSGLDFKVSISNRTRLSMSDAPAAFDDGFSEVGLTDDGSTDGTLEKLASMTNKDGFTLVRHEANFGQGGCDSHCPAIRQRRIRVDPGF